MTYFDVRIPGLPLTVVAADGLTVRPVKVDEFRIAVAETYDVIVQPAAPMRSRSLRRRWTAPAAAETLASAPGRAPVPPLDPQAGADHGDMGSCIDLREDDPNAWASERFRGPDTMRVVTGRWGTGERVAKSTRGDAGRQRAPDFPTPAPGFATTDGAC